MSQSSVILRSVKGVALDDAVEQLMVYCGWESLVPREGSVYIKPNLCTDEIDKVQSANTSGCISFLLTLTKCPKQPVEFVTQNA
jgi:hypothetical protein